MVPTGETDWYHVVEEDSSVNMALAELFRHDQWANLRLLDLCAVLDDEVPSAGAPRTFGPVRETLTAYHRQ